MATETIKNRTSRSPSPAAPPPLAAAPGPRATALQRLHADAIAHVLKTCSYNNFTACFPTPARHVPESLRKLHEEFCVKLGKSSQNEFDCILQDRNVIPALNDLDRLIEDARRRKAKAEEEAQGGPVQAPVPPHTLPAQQLYLSHLAPSLSRHQHALQSRISEVQISNSMTLENVLKQRQEIERLVNGLENAVQDLEGAASLIGEEEVENMRVDCRGAEQEMR